MIQYSNSNVILTEGKLYRLNRTNCFYNPVNEHLLFKRNLDDLVFLFKAVELQEENVALYFIIEDKLCYHVVTKGNLGLEHFED